MTVVAYRPADWEKSIKGLFTYNSFVVKIYVYEAIGKKPKNYEEFKDQVLQYVKWEVSACKGRLPIESRKQFQANIDDNVIEPLRSELEQIIKDAYRNEVLIKL